MLCRIRIRLPYEYLSRYCDDLGIDICTGTCTYVGIGVGRETDVCIGIGPDIGIGIGFAMAMVIQANDAREMSGKSAFPNSLIERLSLRRVRETKCKTYIVVRSIFCKST